MNNKKCTKCGEMKPFVDYGKHKKAKHGLQPACKKCTAKQVAAYREANKEAIKKQRAQYRKINQDVIAERDKKYREQNADTIASRQVAYAKSNKEAIAAYKKEYYQKNKDAFAARKRKWNKDNKEKIAENRRKKYNTDPVFKLEAVLRSRMCLAIKGESKASSTEALLGCTSEQAIMYIEKQFQDGMSWDNHGMHGWHIDHIAPCSSFDLTKPEQQKECFHYTNLQPLWAKDNLRKSNKIPT